MNDRYSHAADAEVDWTGPQGDRVICVVARDVLSLQQRDIELAPLVKTLWQERWLILSFVIVFALAATAYAFLATKWYVAETVLTPASQQAMNSLAGQIPGVDMLAGLAGISLGKQDTAEPIGVLKSRDFARKFIEDQGLLHVLLADKWDARRGRWKESDPRRQPDIRDAVRYFDTHVLNVAEDRKTGLVSLSIRWKNPESAAAWANMIVDRLNEQMRLRALAQAEGNVDYLQKELSSTTEVAMQQAVARLLESELQKLMIAKGSKEFAFRVVDHAAVPKIRAWPKPGVVVALGILGGGLIGLIAGLIRQSVKRHSRPPEPKFPRREPD